MILLVIEWISTIIFYIAGIITITKYALRARVKIYLELFFTIANFFWMIVCMFAGQWGFVGTGIFYTVLGIIGIFNFKRIYRKEKENVK